VPEEEDVTPLPDPSNDSTAGDLVAPPDPLPDPTNLETRGADSLPFDHKDES